MKKLRFFWNELMATFWFIPILIIIISIVLSVVLVVFDNAINIPREGWWRYFFVNNLDSARSILSTISGAMIGVAGTVFSVTLVALTLASSQFGPRLVKNFMYVRLNQVVLGSYISTYLYCLIVLNSIENSEGAEFIPVISILLAIVAAMINIILLIVFIHQIATSIQADNVISDISRSISKQVETLFPEKMGEEVNEKSVNFDEVRSNYKNNISIFSPKSGYFQYVSGSSLISLISDKDQLLELHHRPGSFLVEGQELGRLHYKEEIEDDTQDKICRQFVIGKTKSTQQDLEFSIHKMVEIAARALSPGINDPFTAITCIDNLTATLSYLTQAEFPSKYRLDNDGNLRIVASVLDFEGMLDSSFNQIRQYASNSPAVLIRLMEALNTIAQLTKHSRNKKALVKHAEMILRAGNEHIREENDLNELIQRTKYLLG